MVHGQTIHQTCAEILQMLYREPTKIEEKLYYLRKRVKFIVDTNLKMNRYIYLAWNIVFWNFSYMYPPFPLVGEHFHQEDSCHDETYKKGMIYKCIVSKPVEHK